MDLPQQDGNFTWVDEEGFQGFPKRLPEDCVEYSIFIIDQKIKNQEALLRNKLKDVQATAANLAKALLKDYIWQREIFALELEHTHKLSNSSNATIKHDAKDESPHPYYLYGQTNFGDSIADEWLIVYLLRELSKKHPEAWIRVHDTDGEFLLIEAANTLPKWLNPELAPYRIWINKGRLLIIPLTRSTESGAAGPKTPGLPAEISLKEAITFIETTPKSLIHSVFIEEEAFHRLSDYPAAIRTSHHHALLSIPRKLAYLLHHNPTYISPAVEAFYLRDPIALKPLATKDTATLIFPPEDFVETSVKFSKVGYAQLHSQDYPAPPSWTSVTPRIGNPKVSMGMKLSCGFEMLVRDPQNRDKRAVREINLLLEDLDEGEDELPADSEIAEWEKIVDDEKWLDINFEDFEKELEGKNKAPIPSTTTTSTTKEEGSESHGPAGKAQEGFGDAKTQSNLRNIVSGFEKFLNDDSADPSGAAFSDDDDDNDSLSSYHSSDTDSEKDDGEDKEASFSDAEFERAMREMMGMPAEEKERNGLLEEARKLALEMEDDEEGERDEEKDVEEIMRLMEIELKDHGALNLDGKGDGKESDKKGKGKKTEEVRDAFAAETLRSMNDAKGKGKSKGKSVGFAPGLSGKGKGRKVEIESDDDSVEELSSDDEDPLGGMDADLLKNMLEAFKGQAGMSGPAGNFMEMMGVKMPRDEGDLDK